jgi:hypothetical protein
MPDNENIEYGLAKDAYVNFDAVSLKNFIISKLNENSKFTDQNYEGSNISSLIDIISYSYHVLLFYLNQAATESQFSQASIYENMNKIVNLIGYKPTGKQTSLASVSCTAGGDLEIGGYFLRKYGYFLVDNIQYTINSDFFFEKTTAVDEVIDSIGDNMILYQGTVGEYPIYTGEGVDFETFPIVVDNIVESNNKKFISHGTISVYVREQNTGNWREYSEIDNMFLADSNSRIYDLRLNENGHYEIKFGNNVFGKRLSRGDEVAVYYILSDGVVGVIKKNTINGNKLFNYNSSQFNEIYTDVSLSNDSSILVSLSNNSLLNFKNPLNSSPISGAESVDQIKENAPFLISSQL